MSEEYVRLPKADWLAILDAMRAKEGSSELIVSGELAAKIRAITTGVDLTGVTAKQSDVRTGKTAGFADGVAEGTMQDASVSIASNDITVDANGKVKAVARFGSGYVAGGTAENTNQISYVEGGNTVTPTKSEQTAVAAGRFVRKAIKVGAIPNEYIVPSGKVFLSYNSEFDVTDYTTAVVNVPEKEKYYIYRQLVDATDRYSSEFSIALEPYWSVNTDSAIHYVFLVKNGSTAEGEVACMFLDYVNRRGYIKLETSSGVGSGYLYSEELEAGDAWAEATIINGSVAYLAIGIDLDVYDDIVETTDEYDLYVVFGPESDLPLILG